jgi:hypothetical protein
MAGAAPVAGLYVVPFDDTDRGFDWLENAIHGGVGS